MSRSAYQSAYQRFCPVSYGIIYDPDIRVMPTVFLKRSSIAAYQEVFKRHHQEIDLTSGMGCLHSGISLATAEVLFRLCWPMR